MVKTGLMQVMVITRQHFGKIPTYCLRCKEKISFKIVKTDATYTQLCPCGCTIFQYHAPDEFHKTAFYTKKFIAKKNFDPNHKNKSEPERAGFKKIQEKSGKTVYLK